MLPFSLPLAAVQESRTQHQPLAQLPGPVRGSAQVIQPGPEAGVWVIFENPSALQKGLWDLFWGRNTQVCQAASAWSWIKTA